MTRRPPRPAPPVALIAVGLAGLVALLAAPPAEARKKPRKPPQRLEEYLARVEADFAGRESEPPRAPMHLQPCIGGTSGGVYPCDEVDLLEFMPLATFAGAGNTNSLWGWTDPVTGHEWVLLGLDNGVAFVDVTDPENPYYAGRLPQHTSASLWRDVRVYRDHAFVVSEASGHGMQVFDLRQLRNASGPPDTFTETNHYARVSNTHTLSINETTGHAVLVGTTGTGGSGSVVTCGGNMHLVDLDRLIGILVADHEEGDTSDWTTPSDPAAAFLGCYDDDAQSPGYVHENQCFVYHGPDAAYSGHEICLAARGSASNLDVVDITTPAAPVRIDSFHYQSLGSTYSHQAWFTEDHRYILLNDEFDETDNGHNTRTWIFDALDLDNVVFAGPNGYYAHSTPAIDHNEYVRGSYVFQSNYTAGLRIFELTDLDQDQLTPAGYFDVYPANDNANFDGTWNNYPFFASGTIPVSHMSQGLYLLRPTNLCTAPPAPTGLTATPNGDNRIDLDWTGSAAPGETYRVERALGGCAGAFLPIASGVTATAYSDTAASGQVTYGYRVRAQVESGLCTSAPSACVEASTSGACTAPPQFEGVASAVSLGTGECAVELDWPAGSALCGGPVSYSVYRSAQPDFVPGPAHRVAEALAGTSWIDSQAPSLETAHYVVRATNDANGAEEGNLVHAWARAEGPLGDGTFATGAELGDPMLESGAVGESPEHSGWHVEGVRVHGGSRAYFALPADGLCVALEGEVTLTGGESSELAWWSAIDSAPATGAGVVELSADGGASWVRLVPEGGYPEIFQGAGASCGIAPGTGVISGVGLVTFAPFTVDLSPWAGQTVRVRWLYRADSAATGEGWYVDDVAVSHAQVATACVNP